MQLRHAKCWILFITRQVEPPIYVLFMDNLSEIIFKMFESRKKFQFTTPASLRLLSLATSPAVTHYM